MGNLIKSKTKKKHCMTSYSFMQRAPAALKRVRQIVISWLDGPSFQPRLHSAVPIYPQIPTSRINRRMIRRHNIL